MHISLRCVPRISTFLKLNMHYAYDMCVQITISNDRKTGNPYLIYLAMIIYEAGFILMNVLLNQIIISFVYLIKLLLYIETKESIVYDGFLFSTQGFASKTRCYVHQLSHEYHIQY